MKNIYLIAIILFFHLTPTLAINKTDSLLTVLDIALSNSEVYTGQKENRINRMKEQLSRELSISKQYELCYEIIEEYKSYKCDSAMMYIEKNLLRAQNTHNIIWDIRAKLQYSFVLTSAGLFRESEQYLKNISREDIPEELLVEYFKCNEFFYSHLISYLDENQLADQHRSKMNQYRDSVYLYLPENSPERHFYIAQQLESMGDDEGALKELTAYINSLQPDTHEYGKKSYHKASIYERLGYEEEWIQHMILAAISDTKDAIKEHLALMVLATCLYEKNDIERAYHYIQHALNDANFYNARLRNFQIARTLPIINEAYQQRNEEQNARLKITSLTSSILFLILLITVFFLKKQMKKLHTTRIKLKDANEHLEDINDKLYTLNQELSESNLIKEKYIGHFMDLCSGYIAKLEEYRKMINHKIAAKRFDELLKMTSSSRGKDSEVKELYINFDKAFLNIYPGFVTSFNALLKEKERFEISKEDLLNTELRVFALIRLGITDSNQIADFLRCSVQTVYNYRSKIKKKSLNEEEDIEQQIRKIGNFKRG